MTLKVLGALALFGCGFFSGMFFQEFRIQRWIKRSLDLKNRTIYSIQGVRG